jgi:16S rRNA (cytosine967-C5)-methyltransferase
MRPGNARTLCVQALREWQASRDFADDILHRVQEAHSLSALDRGFLTETFYGVLRNLSALDFYVAQLRDGTVDATTRQVLRLGVYQVLFLRVPDYAAVNETVNIAGRARSLVNALLRRCVREEAPLAASLQAAPMEIRFSHPKELIDRWRNNFGAANTEALCQWNNTPAEIFLRTNSLKTTRDELLSSSPYATAFPGHPLVVRAQHLPLDWLSLGLCYVQDPSTLIACELLDPQPGETLLDACAAPGGKTSYLAQLMNNTGSILACDISDRRLNRLQENLNRLHVTNTKLERRDWLKSPGIGDEKKYDRILLDVPCSNTGVIRRRVDVRWRVSARDWIELPKKQLAMIKNIVPLLKPGGVMVYSTCSLEPEENELLVERACQEIRDLRLIETKQSLPFRDQIDGAFAAKLQRL